MLKSVTCVNLIEFLHLVPLHPCQWPSQPWTRLHLDMDGPFLGHKFLVLIDAHLKWMEVELMTSTTSLAIIPALRKIFAHFSLPMSIVTDNGCNIVSSEFNDFLAHNGIKRWTSALYHPSSNGLVERAVQTFKTNISNCQMVRQSGSGSCSSQE